LGTYQKGKDMIENNAEKAAFRLLSGLVRRATAQNRTQDLKDISDLQALLSKLRAPVADAQLTDYDIGALWAAAPRDRRVVKFARALLCRRSSAPVADERVSDDTLWSWAEQIMGGKEAHHVGRDRVLRFARAALASAPVAHTPRVDALLAQWDDDGATRGAAFIELRDLARSLEQRNDVIAAAIHVAKKSLFSQCCSNPIKNAWGKPVDFTKLNALFDLASAPVSVEDHAADERAADTPIKAAYVEHFGHAAGWLSYKGSWFIEGFKAGQKSAPVAGQAQPVATLHDDGYYTWHGAKPEGYDRAGWRMKVYAAPQASEADPLQGAADWLMRAFEPPLSASDLARQLVIGYNRATRLRDAALSAQPGKQKDEPTPE
jgi:hypothetical protein